MVDSLISLGALLYKIVVPILIIVGVIGNSLNIVVLVRPVFYPHACSRYLLAAAINNVFYSSVVLIYQLLVTGYQLDPSNTSVFICKFMIYFYHVSAYISPYSIVLASMERYFASSTKVTLRRFSSIRVSRWAVAFVVGFFALFGINSFVLITAQPGDGLGCQIPGDKIYNQIYTVMQATFYAFIAPSLMALFGFLTMRNLRQVRVVPVVMSSHRRTESQLVRMLLLQVGIYIVLNVPASITYLIAILPVAIKAKPIFFLIYDVTELLTYTSFSAGFIVYIFGTRSYREEFMLIVRKILHINHHGENRVGTQTRTNQNTIHTIAVRGSTRQNNPVEQTFTN